MAIYWNKKVYKYLLFAAVPLISIVVMGYLIFQSREALLELRTHVQILPILLTFPIFLISSLITGFVWGKVMNSLGLEIPIHQHILIYLATSFWGRLPGGVWHVVGRMSIYERLGVRKRITTIASVLQWFFILYSGVITTLIMLPFVLTVIQLNLVYLVICVLLLGSLINPKVIRFILRRFLKEQPTKEIRSVDIITWLLLYIVIWVLGGIILHLVLYSFSLQGIFIPFSIVVWSVGNVSGTVVTFLPSGLGITEAVTSIMLAIQIPSSIGVLSSILIRLLLTIYDFIVSGVSLLIMRMDRLPIL